MKSEKIDIFFEQALDKMFKMVGFQGFDKDFTKQDNWYNQKEWGKESYQEFRAWFTEKAKKDLKWSSTIIDKEFSYFNLMWGWKIKETSNH